MSKLDDCAASFDSLQKRMDAYMGRKDVDAVQVHTRSDAGPIGAGVGQVVKMRRLQSEIAALQKKRESAHEKEQEALAEQIRQKDKELSELF